MRMPACILGLAFIVMPSGCLATSEPALPPAVIDYIASLRADCQPDNPSVEVTAGDKSHVGHIDLNGDGIEDYYLMDSDIPCEMGASARHGNGGFGLSVFAGSRQNATLAFEKTVGNIHLEESMPPHLQVVVGGGYCGQADFSKADAITCERKLVWNASTVQFELAPISETRFPKAKHPS